MHRLGKILPADITKLSGTKRWTDAADVAVEVVVSRRNAGERQR